jgi:hypothetical protein
LVFFIGIRTPDPKAIEANVYRRELDGIRAGYSGFLEGLRGEHEVVKGDRSGLEVLGRAMDRNVEAETKVAVNHIVDGLVYGMRNSEKARKNAQWLGGKYELEFGVDDDD